MELGLNLQLDENGQSKASKRVKEAEKKKELKGYQPTHEEIWYTGYMTHTGKRKAGIYQTKNSPSDIRKLNAVREAIERGELGVGVDDMKKFTKAHALRLYQVLVKQQREATIKKMIAECPDNYNLINTLDSFAEMLTLLEDEEIIAVDTETTGLDYIDDDSIVGISLTLPKANQHYYIPIGHKTGEKQLSETVVINSLRPYLENPNLGKVLHNAKFDIHMFLKHGVDFKGFKFDTMIGMVLLNENEPSYALKNLATKYGKYFGFEDKSATYEELFGSGGFENTPFSDGNGGVGIGTIYACKDTHLTWEFYKFIQEQFDRLPQLRKYFDEIEREIVEVSVHMEESGFLIDFERAAEYRKELEAELEQLEKELKRYFGDTNLNSPTQLAEYLYDKLELPDVSKKRSTDAKTLKKLAKEYKGCELLLQYRDLNKLLSTYITPLPEKVAKRDKRLHGQFMQAGTVTGRFSSNSPNLQNLPKEARKIIRAEEGKVIVSIDFSQIEPRVLAHLSGDKKFRLPYITGRDLYSEIASNVFNKPIEECGDGSKWRKYAKTVLLGIMYGMSPISLAEMLGIPVSEAERFINDFFTSYEGVSAFVESNKRKIATDGFVTTMHGRKRRFIGHPQRKKQFEAMKQKLEMRYGKLPENIWECRQIPYETKRKYADLQKEVSRAERQSTNFVVQGTAAEIMKKAMIRMYRHLQKKGWKMLATVHDEVLLEVDENITLQEVEELEALMINAVKLDVPIKVDTEFYHEVWGEGVSKAEWFNK